MTQASGLAARAAAVADPAALSGNDAETCLPGGGRPRPADSVPDSELGTVAAAVYRARRRRVRLFDARLFADPAWDMLLDLFVHEVRGKPVPSVSLCRAAEVPSATGLRWIARLEAHGLVRRRPCSHDRRVTWVEITPKAYRLMCRFMAEEIQPGRGG